ncbi:hypothetical protein ACFO4E_09195 [Nocardiopsis mangrovi]|uniref:Uncharacterized protein n=1 Tax=Nocardiopsis mangrovi TaxID=1179818 RepID=A0ABV9DUJ1_9ACTN
MDFRHGGDIALDRFPDSVLRRLADLGRLREVAVARRRHQSAERLDEAREELLRRHVRELHTAAGHGPEPSGGWDDAATLAAVAAEVRDGQRLSPEYLDELADRLPDRDPPIPRPEGFGEVLAEAAAVETHPVVRAAHAFTTCVEGLRHAEHAAPPHAPPAGPDPRLRPLPWALASLSLMRSGYPPPALDHRLAEPQRAAESFGSDADPLTQAVHMFAELESAALRCELSRPARPTDVRPGPLSLATALHRRILDHVRNRCDSLRMVLRELEPGARADVTAGTAGGGSAREHCDSAAARALFLPGPGCWWTSAHLNLTGGVLRLLVSVHDVGTPPTGVLAVTADAWLTTGTGAVDVLDPACTDCVTLIPTDCADERWPQVEAFVDEAVSRTIGHLTSALA